MMQHLKKRILTLFMMSAVTAAVLLTASAAPVAYGTGTVSASKLNLRDSAGLSGHIVSQLGRGDTVVILDKQDDSWYQVSGGGAVGYVSSKYISGVETAENFLASGTVTGTGVRMRSKPGTTGDVLGVYTAGEPVNVIGINNGWYKVTVGNTTGYIRSDLVTLSGGAEQAATAETATEQTATAEAATAEAATEQTAIALSAESPAADTGLSLGQQIADLALQYTGYRYIYGASSPKVGFDCSGLTYYVYGNFGYPISRTASQQFRNNGTEVSKADLRTGDLVFFSSNGGYSVTHVGLYIGDGKFVHASTSRTGVIISDLSSSYYTRVWFGAKRIIG